MGLEFVYEDGQTPLSEEEKEGLREYNFSHAKAKALFTEQKTR